MNVVVSVGLYQLAWFLCVFLGDRGGVIALPLLAVHFAISPVKRADLRLMVLLVIAGLVLDGTLGIAGVLVFSGPARPIPFWLAVIWLFLAILPHHGLKWQKRRPVMSAICGALGGPFAYWAGVRAGDAQFGICEIGALGILAVTWGILWPLVMWYAGHDPDGAVR